MSNELYLKVVRQDLQFDIDKMKFDGLQEEEIESIALQKLENKGLSKTDFDDVWSKLDLKY